VAFLFTAATSGRAECLGGARVIVCAFDPPPARLQSEHAGKGDAADEVAGCESECWSAQVGRELGTGEVWWEYDIIGEYARYEK